MLIDVLRSTTSICHGMAAGCLRMLPVADLGEATGLVESLGRAKLLLGGERDGRLIPGFDLGNSPAEYTQRRLRGSTLVLLTSNGTAALARLRHLRAVAIASFANLGAAARWLAEEGRHAVIICAGQRDQFCLEDSVCAGLLARRLMEALPEGFCELNDAARVGLALAERWSDLRNCLAEAGHGRALAEMGMGDDLEFCARLDELDLLPFFNGEQISLDMPDRRESA